MDHEQAGLPYPGQWNAPWLTKPVFCTFIILFYLLAGSLFLIRHLAIERNGLSLDLMDNRYVWTYGPTLILVIIISLYRRVNYYVLVNQPWQELRNGPQTAERTVLLDYLWPIQLSSFALSIKHRHFAVTASLGVLWLLKAAALVSTTLFLPQESTFHDKVPIGVMSRFASDRYLKYAHDPNMGSVFADVFPAGLNNVSASPVWAYAYLTQQYPDAPAPVQDSTAFTNFSLGSQIPGRPVSLFAEVNVVSINVTCEIPSIEDTNVQWRSWMPGFELQMRTPSCEFNKWGLRACPGLYVSDHNENTCGARGRIFAVTRSECHPRRGDGNVTKTAADPVTYHYNIAAAEMDLPIPRPAQEDYDTYTTPIDRLSAISCSLSYSIHNGSAYSGSGMDSSRVRQLEYLESSGELASFNSSQLLDAAFASLQSAQAYRGPKADIVLPSLGSEALFELLTGFKVGKVSHNMEPLWDQSNFKDSTEEILGSIGQQLMREYFLLPSDDSHHQASGLAEFTVRRLHVREAALWAMVALFILGSFLVTTVMVHVQRGVMPRSPGTLFTIASVLCRSTGISKILTGTGANSLDEIRKQLSGYRFYAVQTPEERWHHRIEARENAPVFQEKEEEWPLTDKSNNNISAGRPRTTKMDWMPYSSRKHGVALTLLLPLILVACLEILWHFLESDENFLTIPDSSIQAYAIRYGSTIAVLIVATLFNVLDFSIMTMAPFSRLSIAITSASARQTLFHSMVEDIMPVALCKAVRHGYIGAALSILASTIGSVLTIMTSGLWIAHGDMKIPTAASVRLDAGWDIDFTAAEPQIHLGADQLTSMALGVIVNNDLVRDTLVFPSIGKDTMVIDRSSQKPLDDGEFQNFTLRVAAIEPFLECSVLPDSATEVSNKSIYGSWTVPAFDTTAQLPEGCHTHTHDDGNIVYDTVQFSNYGFGNYDGTALDGDKEVGYNGTAWFGGLKDLRVTSETPENQDCPSLGASFGWVEKLQQGGMRYDVTAILCTQRLSYVETEATYSNPVQDKSAAPRVLAYRRMNSTTIPVMASHPHSGASSLSYKIANMFYSHVVFWGQYALTSGFWFSGGDEVPVTDIPAWSRFGQFLSYLIEAPHGLPMDRVIKPSTLEALKSDPKVLINGVNNLYQQLMVQVLDLDLRTRNRTVDTITPLPPFLASNDRETTTSNLAHGTTVRTVERLKIGKTSKVALQAMLTTMAVLGTMAFWLVRMRGILPRNPYPIASGMALFERSRLLVSLARCGTTENQREQQQQKKLLETTNATMTASQIDGNVRLRLGWWALTSTAEEEKEDQGGDCGGGSESTETLLAGAEDMQHYAELEEEQVGQKREEGVLVEGRRFGIDMVEEGICRTGWVTIEEGAEEDEWGRRRFYSF